ncbi:thiol reductant ABC exporter subunit CydD [Acetobacter cibinongensis]|uniref:ABC transporter ATP-binding protein n=1 Tax=Acetobacter cibinongensis TaxID=146475 RepID=A0A1Z5YVG6_9PROT|nr:thiol reductant ABC exporter subunit CydD [Acetobacter cibinongensis]OUJ02804.1 ABC transporter ATP-binding protein [Acetobacter cibinongensis]
MQSSQSQTQWQLSGLTRRARGLLGASVALGSGAAILFVWQLSLLAHLVDDLTFQGQPLTSVENDFLKVIAFSAGFLVLQWLADMAGTEAGLRISASVQQDGLKHLFRAGPVGCATQPTGQLVTTLTEATTALEPYFAQYIPRAAMMVVLPLFILARVFALDGWSFAVLACTGPLVPLFMALVGYSAQSVMDRQWVQLVLMGSSFMDYLKGLRTVRLFAQTQNSIKAMTAQTEAHRLATLSVMRIAFLTSAVLEFFASLSIALVAVIFGARLLSGTADFRSAFLVLLLAPEYFMPLRAFSASYHARQNANAAAKRLADLFTLPAYAAARYGTEQPKHAGSVEALSCHMLSAGYAAGKTEQINCVTATFYKGQLSVLVGESGAGKTTLLRAILGFLPLSSGTCTASDQNGQSIALQNCRMAWVPQRPLLVFGTIAENLRLAAPHASLADLHHVAEQADILPFIQSLPHGFETQVGERGSTLSGGQLKRLALARALLGKPDILCVDEPTAHLNSESAASITQTLSRCARDCIVIAATHQDTLIRHADQVLYVSQGHVTSFRERAVA